MVHLFSYLVVAFLFSPRLLWAQDVVAITGAEGGVHPRLEIRKLQENPEQFYLFMQAFQSLANKSMDNPRSLWQIAGIHGLPYVPYSGVGKCNGCVDTGYCTHGMTLFPTWHRPYMALIEQVIQAEAYAFIRSLDNNTQNRYVEAARSLRLPYWDWAANYAAGDDDLPAIVSNSTVNVVTPEGNSMTIPNPLYAFGFGAQGGQLVGRSGDTTSIRGSDAVANMNSAQKHLQEQLYELFSREMDYDDFSTFSIDHPGYDDLEIIHGQPHVLLGGYMPDQSISAFDPVFWLHHSMVDRVLALWQALWPQAWITDSVVDTSTFTITADSHQNGGSPLMPFYADQSGNFWTTDKARNIESLNYTYPELVGGVDRAGLAAAINSLYGGQSFASPTTLFRKTNGSPGERAVAPLPDINGLQTPDGAIQEYSVQITVPANLVDCSYTIYLFNEQPHNTEWSEWSFEPITLGSKAIFLNNMPRVRSARISITKRMAAFAGKGVIGNLTERTVEAYLREHLWVRVVTFRGYVVPIEAMSGVQASLLSFVVTPTQSITELPKYGPIKAVANLAVV